MSIRSRDNLYNGVNAHLHSRLQAEPGGWEVFHAAHIIDIGRAIDALLPPGYLIEPEKSLQIRAYDPDTGEPITPQKARRPRPDLTIYAQNPQPTAPGSTSTMPTLTLPAREAVDLDEEIYLTALAIREIDMDGEPGQAVTWLELLSPTNKPPGDGYLQYREKRNATLHAGTALVEIDYLHEKRSPLMRLPSYPQREKDSFPYTIVVTDPRPSLDDGQMKLYGMHVDDPLPSIPIPLREPDTITLDMQPVYNLTYRSFGSYSQRVDYAALPDNFERYSPADQARINRRMQQIAQTTE